ncbi:MAG TPA: tetratricopeptide repeat protein [Bacteroidales bacterium]|nr:tetratricopeptide repeat protein [Bacteroidales bacterium]
MLKRKCNTVYFNERHHLTDEVVARCAEAMITNIFPDNLPDEVITHLTACESCNERVIKLYEDVKDEPEIVQSIVLKHQSVNKSSTSFIKIFRYAAAAILLILIAGGSYFFLRPASTEKLFFRYFEAYPNIKTVKSGEAGTMSKALLYYEVKDFDSAILLMNDILLREKNNAEIMFYLANAYLAEGESENAILWLKKSAAENSDFSDQINWYLALAYLQQNDTKTARSHLEMLAGKNNFYREKACKLIRQLR